ncbi:hypothetical protein [Amycolatopsis nigrescens]|uniref:hypothetical protein n=1 Tax=Amycolatopsis nigrescens TaxID=381445 RepID=UPI00036780FE|nr:hypothetical protein [Amycolatopsis nigrescens]
MIGKTALARAITAESITAECFPTPELALRSNDPAKQAKVRAFAGEQAVAARRVCGRLAAALAAANDRGARFNAVWTAFDAVQDWRYQLALASAEATGRYGRDRAERFRTQITDDTANYDRLGEVGRLREGSAYDQATRTWTGGEQTPASLAMRRIGELAARRFAPGADVAHNHLVLPSGLYLVLPSGRATGARLLRGDVAKAAADELTARVAARGEDASQMEVGGDLLYAATGSTTDRRRIWAAAMGLLAGEYRNWTAARNAWAKAAYLLYQAPQMKKGSDSVNRVFLVAAGTVLLGRPPVLLHDIDLRAYVLPEHEFVTELLAVQPPEPAVQNERGAVLELLEPQDYNSVQATYWTAYARTAGAPIEAHATGVNAVADAAARAGAATALDRLADDLAAESASVARTGEDARGTGVGLVLALFLCRLAANELRAGGAR